MTTNTSEIQVRFMLSNTSVSFLHAAETERAFSKFLSHVHDIRKMLFNVVSMRLFVDSRSPMCPHDTKKHFYRATQLC